jgi:pyruvate,water dikinase
MAQAEKGNKKLAEELEKCSGAAVFDFIKKYQSQLRKDLYDPTGMAAVLQSTFANAWLNKHIEKWTGEKNIADILTQSAPHNITSEMGLDLLDVSDVIRKYPGQIEVLKTAKDDSFFDGLNDAVTAAVRGYLSKYGMRCPGEIDITRPRFNEKPTMLVPLIISNIQNFEIGERERQFNRGTEKYENKKRELISNLGNNSARKKKLLRKISLLRNFAGYREFPKYMLICRYWIIKQALMREAKKLAESGVLAQWEDMNYLTFEEFRAAVQTGKADKKLIDERKKRHAYYEKLTPPRIMTSDGESVSGEYNAADKPDGALLGVAVSSGIAEGTARVIESLGETIFSPDDILVTKFTDPSWTPAFVSIKALVTEVGGTMTHGAVIAREYGLPAVVSVENATKLIKDGQKIRVNGTSGYIEILD